MGKRPEDEEGMMRALLVVLACMMLVGCSQKVFHHDPQTNSTRLGNEAKGVVGWLAQDAILSTIDSALTK